MAGNLEVDRHQDFYWIVGSEEACIQSSFLFGGVVNFHSANLQT